MLFFRALTVALTAFCSVTLSNCAVGFNYFVRCVSTQINQRALHDAHLTPCSDWSFISPSTASDTMPHSRASPFLLSLTATGAVVTQTANGYTLCPTQPNVTLSYSTQTCDEFYRCCPV